MDSEKGAMPLRKSDEKYAVQDMNCCITARNNAVYIICMDCVIFLFHAFKAEIEIWKFGTIDL